MMGSLASVKYLSGPLLLASFVVAQSPGCIIPLSTGALQLPVGSPGSPTTIQGSQLAGCNGYQDQYFFYDSDDASLVMTVPGAPSSGKCVTTPNSKHCRTELRESSPSSWDPNGPANRMQVSLAVPQPDNSAHGTVVGQIHIDESVSTKPVCELYYNSQGQLALGVEQTRAGGNQVLFDVGTVPVGQKFSYILSYENNVLSLSLDNQPAQTFSTFDLDAPKSYFKVGNYNQGSSPSEVHFFAISVSHSTSGTIPPSTTSSPGGSSPTACAVTGPGNDNDNTVTLALYKSSTCCDSAAMQTFKIGTLGVCHTASDTFDGITQSVGQNLFGQGIHIKAYFNTNCGGNGTTINLSNYAGCSTHQSADSWGSFAVVQG